MRISHDNLKNIFINIIVDGASIVLIAAALYSASIALYTLYSSYYKTLSLPTPESFSTASFQMASAISFVFAVFFTRKYKKPMQKVEQGEGKHEQQPTTSS